MADITMCSGIHCDIKLTCYRYTAPISDDRQSWSDAFPDGYDNKTKECKYFWNNEKYPIGEHIGK